MDESILKGLVNEFSKAIIRTRNVFVIINIISIVFLVGYFNHRWTWLRHIAPLSYSEMRLDNSGTENRPPEYLEYNNPGENSGVIDIREELIKSSIGGDFKFVKFNLIGTKIFVDDLPILGGVALLIIMIWFQYVIRREKGIAVAISKRVEKEESPEIVRFLFYGTAFNEIFNSIPGIDQTDDENHSSDFEARVLVFMRRLMLFAPAILLALIIVHDFLETFIQRNLIVEGEKIQLFNYLVNEKHIGQIVEIFVRLFLSLALVGFSFHRTVRVVQINKKLKEHMDKIQKKFLFFEEKEV